MGGGWPSMKAARLLAALKRAGWREKRVSGSHRTLERPGWSDFVFAFHGNVEVGPGLVREIARQAGLRREDL